MKISIITPCYNGRLFVGQTIQSVRRQSFRDWEYIIVDDGSTDGSGEIVEALCAEDLRLRLVRQANQGVAAARNAGYRLATGEFVIFLDHDDLWEPEALEVLRDALESHPGWVAAHGLARYLNPIAGCGVEDIERWGRERAGFSKGKARLWPLSEPTTFANLILGNCIPTPGLMLLRRTALERAGAFDARAVPADDWDFWLRLARLGDIGFLDAVLLQYRQHGDNVSHDLRKMARAERYVRHKMIISPENTITQKRLARAGCLWSLGLKLRHKQALACAERKRGHVGAALRQGSYLVKPGLEYLRLLLLR